jgi:hypothetical protein
MPENFICPVHLNWADFSHIPQNENCVPREGGYDSMQSPEGATIIHPLHPSFSPSRYRRLFRRYFILPRESVRMTLQLKRKEARANEIAVQDTQTGPRQPAGRGHRHLGAGHTGQLSPGRREDRGGHPGVLHRHRVGRHQQRLRLRFVAAHHHRHHAWRKNGPRKSTPSASAGWNTSPASSSPYSSCSPAANFS